MRLASEKQVPFIGEISARLSALGDVRLPICTTPISTNVVRPYLPTGEVDLPLRSLFPRGTMCTCNDATPYMSQPSSATLTADRTAVPAPEPRRTSLKVLFFSFIQTSIHQSTSTDERHQTAIMTCRIGLLWLLISAVSGLRWPGPQETIVATATADWTPVPTNNPGNTIHELFERELYPPNFCGVQVLRFTVTDKH